MSSKRRILSEVCFLPHSSATDASDLLDADVLSLESSDSALLASSQEEQDGAVEGKNIVMEPSQPACPVYNELLEVMALTSERLDLAWKREKPQIHSEVERPWKKTYLACIHLFHHVNYVNMEGM